MNVLITSGGTEIMIDMVRHIGNMSSGTFGSKIALECLKRGDHVTFLKAKNSKSPISTTISDDDNIWNCCKKALQKST